jgi:hypothetical protein
MSTQTLINKNPGPTPNNSNGATRQRVLLLREHSVVDSLLLKLRSL